MFYSSSPDTAYVPFSKIEGGVHASVAKEAAALRDLLLKFDNITDLIFGLGSYSALRPPLETAILHAFDGLQLPNVRRLCIEDTAMHWLRICPNVDDLTLYLGYQDGPVEWQTAPKVRKLMLHNTSCCHAEEPDYSSYVPPVSEDDPQQPQANLNRGPGQYKQHPLPFVFCATERQDIDIGTTVITKAFSNVKVLYLEDCDRKLEVRR